MNCVLYSRLFTELFSKISIRPHMAFEMKMTENSEPKKFVTLVGHSQKVCAPVARSSLSQSFKNNKKCMQPIKKKIRIKIKIKY